MITRIVTAKEDGILRIRVKDPKFQPGDEVTVIYRKLEPGEVLDIPREDEELYVLGPGEE